MVLFLLGCLTITYTRGPAEVRPYNHQEWHHRFLAGTIEVPGPYDATTACSDGVAQVRTEVSLGNMFAASAANSVGEMVGVDTSGAYTPSTITVWCERPVE